MKNNDPDIIALKRAKAALLKSSSKKMMRANLNYLYDYFVTNPPESLQAHWKNKDAAQQKLHPTPESLASSQAVSNADNFSQSDSESKPAQARVS